MSLVFRILRAAHARGTHHKLALDALSRMRHPDAAKWERVFLEHAQLYVAGAKAPDDEFKDFQNHVLHPRDRYWGGAPEKVASWYAHLVTALKAGNFAEAAWCAGVLSHYATDPVHPFHTAQSEAENNIHAAAEWSINRAYDDLWRDGIARHADLDVAVPDDPHWIKAMVCAAADRSNRDYERLIAHYDIHRGVVDPPSGLDANARAMVSELLVYAATLHARLLDRAIAEAGVAPPEVSLTLDAVMALVTIPVKQLLKKLADADDRRAVEAMYDELVTTGRVETTLREDDRTVRNAHAREVLAKREASREAARVARIPADPAAAAAEERARRLQALPAVPPAAPAQGSGAVARAPASAPALPPFVRSATAAGDEPPPLPAAAGQTRPVAPTLHAVPVAADDDGLARLETRRGPSRQALALAAPLEAAPSIGPRMAQRFAALGVVTVGDFLAADPSALASTLASRNVTPAVLVDWQDQTRLATAIPGLRSAHAQLLVGAGLRSVGDIAAAAPDDLSARLLAFATTPEGQRILREGEPPDIARIKGWVEAATTAAAA